MLDVLTIISSDRRFPFDGAALMAGGQTRLVHTFRSGAECLRAFELEGAQTRRVVVIDSVVSDIAPANLCDALRMTYPKIAVLLVVAEQNAEEVERGMLAGACATIARSATPQAFEQSITRICETLQAQKVGLQRRRSGVGTAASSAAAGGRALQQGDILAQATASLGHSGIGAGAGLLLPVLGARGGAGRSTLSCLLAWLAAASGVDTALVDFDLQFGDLRFLLGASSELTLQEFLRALQDDNPDRLYSQGGSAQQGLREFGQKLTENLTLYAPDPAPEKAELLCGLLDSALQALRAEHRLLVVNTGAFWTLFHAELLERSDLALCVLDQSIAGVRATRLLFDLCQRLGIASSKLFCVMNRRQREGLQAEEVAQTLRVDQVQSIADGGPEVSLRLESGQLRELVEQGAAPTAEVALLLDEIAVRTDLQLHTASHMRAVMRREQARRKRVR